MGKKAKGRWRNSTSSALARRFRGYLPVVVDVETSGLDYQRHAILEIAAAILDFDANGRLAITTTYNEHLLPFAGAEFDPEAMRLNGIDPSYPLRFAKPERAGLLDFLKPIHAKLQSSGCRKAILVGHNAVFDLSFLQASSARAGVKLDCLHRFSVLDTVSLGALACGHTVLATACRRMGLHFDNDDAHTALYDVELTAQLFCAIVNQWQDLGGRSVFPLREPLSNSL